ncbi:hypothetical protein EV426DRAFT_716628 [Tirmania nivea]|nr:hypothetical protein EV426DRAFT_716628 [Tirmania nivea]
MSQPQELPTDNPAHNVPVHVQAPGQYQYPPTSQPLVSEYVPTPSQTSAPHSTTPASPQSNILSPQIYGSPDQYGSYAPPPQPPQQGSPEYYQQPAHDAEKGGVPAYISPPGGSTSAPLPVEGPGTAPPAMITVFGKKFTKQTIIIIAIIIVVILIFIVGLGAGLGVKGKKNKKKNSSNFSGTSSGDYLGDYTGGYTGDYTGNSGCSGCDCITDPQLYSVCSDAENLVLDNI